METAKIEQAVKRLMKVAGTPGAALAVVHGEATYTGGFGTKEMGKDAPVTTETLFANASTTKAFTTAGIALLVDEGKMQWDDPVRKYLPQFRLADVHADALVTVRDLVCHRTGLPRHDMLWYHSPYNREEVLRRVGFAKLSETFRRTYQYQNICYAAAGECCRVASGFKTWETFLRERLLTPLEMTRTNLSERNAQTDPDHAEPHQRKKNKIVQTEWLNFDNVGPAGTMNSCATEMVHWLRFQLSGGIAPNGEHLLSEKALRETHKPQMVIPTDDETRSRFPYIVQQAYCLGWALGNYRNGYPVLCHGGAIDGFRAHVALIPSENIGIAVFGNLGGPLVDYVRNSVFDLLLDLDPMDWSAYIKEDLSKAQEKEKEEEKKRREQRKNRIPIPLPLETYVGEYDSATYGLVVVTLTDKTLSIRWNAMESELRHQTYQTFITTTEQDGFEDREVRFRANAAGEIISLQLFDNDFGRK
ncbi:MAG: serine hydrolase [Armatimonadaceae bacterium]